MGMFACTDHLGSPAGQTVEHDTTVAMVGTLLLVYRGGNDVSLAMRLVTSTVLRLPSPRTKRIRIAGRTFALSKNRG